MGSKTMRVLMGAAVGALVAAGVVLGAGPAAASEGVCGEAVALIAERVESGQPMFEDLTWAGAPAIVGACNDGLLDGYSGPMTRAAVAAWLRAGQAEAGGPVVVLSPDYASGASEGCWSALRDAGFRGRPGDAREAFYVPAGQLRELCPTA